MNRTEVQDLLELIEGFERRAFPKGAVEAWLTLMSGVQYQDAMRAVVEHFDTPEPIAGGVQPGPLKRRALVLAEQRERAERRALTGPPAYTPPNAEYRAAFAELVRKFGDQSRSPRQPMRADASRPTSPDSEITEDARSRQLRALANAA